MRPAETPVSAVIHISRSGRTVKRNSFYDEIEEGEQHLRSDRNPLENRSSYDEDADSEVVETSETVLAHLDGSSDPVLADTGPTADALSSLKPPPAQVPHQNLPSSVVTSAASTVPASANGPDSVPPMLGAASTPPTLPQTTSPMSTLQAGTAPVVSAAAATAAAVQTPGTSSVVKFAALPKYAGSASVGGPPSTAGAAGSAPAPSAGGEGGDPKTKVPRRKPGARECVQISRRFGNRVIPEKYLEILLDYCSRGKVEHLIRMRERLDEHSRFLELQLAGLENLVREKGESNVTVPVLPEGPDRKLERTLAGDVASSTT